MQSETQRSSESRFLVPLSPRLCQDVSAKTSPFSPPIILAEVRKVDNP